MNIVLYNIFLLLYRIGIFLSSFWNKKAKLWRSGRINIFENLAKELKNGKPSINDINQKITWVHCSSLGEFEQGRPVIEKLKLKYPEVKILLTFFSPSGYEIRKNYKSADWVFYLPLDSKANANKFMDIVNPSLVVFVKYDFWYYYLEACKEKKIPLLMISAIFKKEQPFFRWYGGLYRNMLKSFTHLFVQEEPSRMLLQQLQITNVSVTGDTRFDRVAEIADKFQPVEEIKKFCGKSRVLVAGSTWPADEKLIKETMLLFPDIKLIIAPHEIHQQRLDDIKILFTDSIYFSQLESPEFINGIHSDKPESANCLIIDNIGMLSNLYSYAAITYVGGGFDQGIHNLLEAAVFGKPVIFGPKFEKFQEAIDLYNSGAGFSVMNKDEMKKIISLLLNDHKLYSESCNTAKKYVLSNKGAAEKILLYIQENRLLTK